MVHTRRDFLTLAAASTVLAVSSVSAQESTSVLKVAFVYVGSIDDSGWNYAHERGRQMLSMELAGVIETSFVENVADEEDALEVFRELARNGNEVIFATSAVYRNSVSQVAREFPHVKFEHLGGIQRTGNLSTYNARYHEGRSIIGTIAGFMSEVGYCGYVASFPIPEVIAGINAFTLAAQRINPNFVTRVSWSNSWNNAENERDLAHNLIDRGVDVLAQHTDSTSVVEVAEKRDIFCFGQASDMSSFAPKMHLSAIVNDWHAYYTERVRAVLDGRWRSGDRWLGVGDGVIDVSPFNPTVTEAAVRGAEVVREGLVQKDWHPFAGQIYDNEGMEQVAYGQTLPDSRVLGMDWFVAGVTA